MLKQSYKQALGATNELPGLWKASQSPYLLLR